ESLPSPARFWPPAKMPGVLSNVRSNPAAVAPVPANDSAPEVARGARWFVVSAPGVGFRNGFLPISNPTDRASAASVPAGLRPPVAAGCGDCVAPDTHAAANGVGPGKRPVPRQEPRAMWPVIALLFPDWKAP